MNRAERRRQAKLTGSSVAKDPIISMKKSDIDRIKRKAADEATETAMILLLSIPIKVMHEQFGWGMKKRLSRLSDALIDEYQAFSDGDMTLEEYQNMVYEYCGVKFQKNKEET